MLDTKYALFSLTNGAEVIGSIDTQDQDTITIDHPLVIRPIEKGPNKWALDLFPHSLANPEGKHKFNTRQILSYSQLVPDELERAYVERTSRIILSGALSAMEAKM